MKNELILNKNKILKMLGSDYKNLTNIISDKFGIINAILKRNELSKYDLFMYQCLSANARDLFDIKREVSGGGLGVNENEQIAIIGCLAEALERYCMSFIPKEEICFEFLNKINKENAFYNFFTYNEEQYNCNKQFKNPYKDKIYWTKIYSINDTKKWKYWPASLIYLPFEIDKPVAEITSTGMAAGLSIYDCIKSGLLELIERDALMINFLQRLNPPQIDIDSIDGYNKQFIQKISKDYNIRIYKLYSDINVPTFLSYIWTEKKGKIHYGIGACSNLDSDYAINKSLKECLFTYFYSNNIMREKKNNPNDIKALYEHFLYYQDEKFYNLLFKSRVVKYERQIINFSDLKRQLKENNIEVYFKELTTEDIKDTRIKVVKVIAPGLIDLNKTHKLPRLGAKRFWSVPEKLNLKFEENLSNDPHPFP